MMPYHVDINCKIVIFLNKYKDKKLNRRADRMRKDWLYPKSKPFNTGEIKTADGKFTIPYKEYGNPNGIPIVYLHGGPGAGTPPYAYRFFDPEAFHVIT